MKNFISIFMVPLIVASVSVPSWAQEDLHDTPAFVTGLAGAAAGMGAAGVGINAKGKLERLMFEEHVARWESEGINEWRRLLPEATNRFDWEYFGERDGMRVLSGHGANPIGARERLEQAKESWLRAERAKPASMRSPFAKSIFRERNRLLASRIGLGIAAIVVIGSIGHYNLSAEAAEVSSPDYLVKPEREAAIPLAMPPADLSNADAE